MSTKGGGGSQGQMEKSMLNFHFDFLTPSLKIHPFFGTVNPSLTFMGNLYACLVFRQIDFPLLLDISKNTNIKEW